MVVEKSISDKRVLFDINLKEKLLSEFGFSINNTVNFSGVNISSFKQLVLFKRVFEKVFITNCSSFKKYWAVNSQGIVYFKKSKVNVDSVNSLLNEYKYLWSDLHCESYISHRGVVVSVSNNESYANSNITIFFHVGSYGMRSKDLFLQEFLYGFKDRLVVSSSKVVSLGVVKNNPLVRDFLGGGVSVSWSGCPLIKNYLDQPVSAGFRVFNSGVLVVKTARLYKACLFQKNFWGGFFLKEVSVGEAVALINKFKVSKKEVYLADEVESKLNQYSLLKNI